MPDDLTAHLDLAAITPPAVFSWLQKLGGVADSEMLRTFNCGIGMILVAEEDKVDDLMTVLSAAGEAPVRLGTLKPRDGDAVVYDTMISFGA